MHYAFKSLQSPHAKETHLAGNLRGKHRSIPAFPDARHDCIMCYIHLACRAAKPHRVHAEGSVAAPTASQRQQRRSVDPALQRQRRRSVAASTAPQRHWPNSSIAASLRRRPLATSQRHPPPRASQRRSATCPGAAPPAPRSVTAKTSETHVSAPLAPPLTLHLSPPQTAPHPPLNEPTCRPSETTKQWKNIVFFRAPASSFFWFFFVLSTYSFSSLVLPTFAFAFVFIVGSLTSKLPLTRKFRVKMKTCCKIRSYQWKKIAIKKLPQRAGVGIEWLIARILLHYGFSLGGVQVCRGFVACSVHLRRIQTVCPPLQKLCGISIF